MGCAEICNQSCTHACLTQTAQPPTMYSPPSTATPADALPPADHGLRGSPTATGAGGAGLEPSAVPPPLQGAEGEAAAATAAPGGAFPPLPEDHVEIEKSNVLILVSP